MAYATPDPPPAGQRLFAWVLAFGIAGLGVSVLIVGRGDEDPSAREQFLRVAVAVLSFWSAALWLALQRMRHDMDRLEDLLEDVRMGAGVKRDRDAVDILVKALRTPDAGTAGKALANLRRISGLDLGEDPSEWEEWWRNARGTFVRLRPRSDAPGAP
jgi:hypothetical protein